MSPLAELSNVGFRYRRGCPVLDGLSLTVPDSGTLALTGRSGSGKSTALYLLGLMLRPQQGKVIIAGRDTSSASDSWCAGERAGSIGFLFQDALLDASMTVLDNVLEGVLFTRYAEWRATRERAVDLLSTFGLEGLRTRRASGLSGGQAQRVALCRAVLKDPALLLADEPTGNLDDETATVVIDALLDHAHRPGHATVIVTHDQRVAARCDHIVEMGTAP